MVAIARPVKRGATYADIEALPDHVVGEIVGGELYVTPRPAPLLGFAVASIGADLRPCRDWWLLREPECHLGENVLVPNLVGWRRARVPRLPPAHVTEAPDWVCEVLSPSTALLDRGPKLEAYARHGVGHAWLVDPVARCVEVLELDAGAWVLHTVRGDRETARLPPFDAVELDLAAWWAPDDDDPGAAPAV